MIVVDSSALLAILFDEIEKQDFSDILLRTEHCVMSAVNAHESAIVMRVRVGRKGVENLWKLIAAYDIKIVAFDTAQVRAAAIAFDRYGKGLDSKARLNLCDCAAYALAKTMDAPLLFKGHDFSRIDLTAAA